jgi:hypothetical protein
MAQVESLDVSARAPHAGRHTLHTAGRPGALTRGLRVAFAVCAWTFALGILAQAYLAGLSIFAAATWIEAHSALGWLLGLAALALAVLVFMARLSRGVVALTVLLFALTFVQVGLVSWLRALHTQWLTALHPANALILFVVALTLAVRASRRDAHAGP